MVRLGTKVRKHIRTHLHWVRCVFDALMDACKHAWLIYLSICHSTGCGEAVTSLKEQREELRIVFDIEHRTFSSIYPLLSHAR